MRLYEIRKGNKVFATLTDVDLSKLNQQVYYDYRKIKKKLEDYVNLPITVKQWSINPYGTIGQQYRKMVDEWAAPIQLFLNETGWDFTDKDLDRKYKMWKIRYDIINELCQQGGI